MAVSQGFADLRSASLSAGSHTDDSVWPSFTDIMTVVVMIFLMSLVVILLRNVELVKSEQHSAHLAQLKASENVELEHAIAQLEQRIAKIQLQLQAQVLQTAQRDKALAESQQQVTGLMADIQALQFLRDKLTDENTVLAAAKLALEGKLKLIEADHASLTKLHKQTEQDRSDIEDENKQLLLQIQAALSDQRQLQSSLESLQQEKLAITQTANKTQSDFAALRAVYSVLQKDNRSLVERVNDAEEMILELEQNLASANRLVEQNVQALHVAEKQAAKTSQALIQSQEQFSALEQKYLELVGPARSEINKYVVAIRYQRVGSETVIEIADPAGGKFVKVSASDLHLALADLKRRKADDLYTRVVIPPDSGLSYDEAWQFTNKILRRYDYFYQ